MEETLTSIGNTFLGLVEKGFLGIRGELLLGLIAEVFASGVEIGVSQWFKNMDGEMTYPRSDMIVVMWL